MPLTSGVIAVAVAFLVVEDQTVRSAVVAVCVINVLVAPQILKRAARDG
jgi:hypothetical protein